MKGIENMNINDITLEKDIYFTNQEIRNREEAEKLEQEKAHLRAYKESIIQDILKSNSQFVYEELKRMSIRTLERIW